MSNKRIVGVLAAAAVVTAVCPAHCEQNTRKGIIRMQPVFVRDPRASYQFEGMTGRYISAVQENWLKVMLKHNPRVLKDIEDRNKQPYRALEPWAGEFAGKHLTGAVEVLRITRDPALRQNIAEFVDKLVSLQATNGYLGVFPDEYEFTGKQPLFEPPITCDEWGHYHIMLGLLLWYKESGDAKALNAAKRIGDVLCETFLGKPGKLTGACIREFDYSPAHGLALLYKETGERKYLDLALQIIDEELPIGAGEGYPRGVDFVTRALAGEEYFENTFPSGKRWECMHTLMGLSELYWITGREKYAKTLEHTWWSMVRFERHNNGGWGSMEGAVGSPYEVRSMELCCDVAWIAYGVEMLRLTGNSIAADEMELAYLNYIQGYQHRSGAWESYNVPSDGRRVPCLPEQGAPNRPDDVEICCCSVNGPRGFGLLSEWAVMMDKDGLVLNWYGPSKLTAHVGDVPVTLAQETDYPRTGKIRLSVEPEKAAEFTLKLRIPHWSKKTRVSVNGEPVEQIRPGSYLSIKRKWQPGDSVEIGLDMSLHFWVGEDEVAGRASIYRGPVLMTMPHKNVKDAIAFKGDWTTHISARHLPYADLYCGKTAGDSFSYEFEGDRIAWLYNPFDDCGKAEVKIDGKSVEVIDQYRPHKLDDYWVYDRTKPNLYLSARWERTNLGPGKHTIEITVLGEHSPDSKDNWVNVRELMASSDDPTFDARKMRGRLLKSKDTMVDMEFTDVDGHKIRLQDFDSAGENGNPYISWLRIENAPKVEWTQANPTRSGR